MFRNKEIRKFTVCFVVITVVSVAVGFSIVPAAGISALVSAAFFGVAFFLFTRARYRSIAGISEQIDLVLHNEDRVFISEAQEGELSILQSEITKMTLRLREQNEELKREKKNLADSLADIAHQLRTPLTSANLTISLLKKNPEEDERRRLLRETQNLFAQMDWLITSLLKLSRLDAGVVVMEKKKTEVSRLAEEALLPFQISMELHDISVKTDIPCEAYIYGDSRWITEAMQNIIKNCIESIRDGGKIEITCEDNLLYTEIIIHDSGAGFGKEDLSRLFDRFYKGKNMKEAGYGIGLALSRTIIARQGGTVTAKNHPQGGAAFFIRFPK